MTGPRPRIMAPVESPPGRTKSAFGVAHQSPLQPSGGRIISDSATTEAPNIILAPAPTCEFRQVFPNDSERQLQAARIWLNACSVPIGSGRRQGLIRMGDRMQIEPFDAGEVVGVYRVKG